MGTLVAIAYTEDAVVALAAIQPKKVRQQIKKRIDALANDPKPPGSAKVIGVMDGPHEVYRVRQGKHRVLYSVRGDTEVVVLDIGHRKDVYRD
jgi:mRNA interferase RelE/StbE